MKEFLKRNLGMFPEGPGESLEQLEAARQEQRNQQERAEALARLAMETAGSKAGVLSSAEANAIRDQARAQAAHEAAAPKDVDGHEAAA